MTFARKTVVRGGLSLSVCVRTRVKQVKNLFCFFCGLKAFQLAIEALF